MKDAAKMATKKQRMMLHFDLYLRPRWQLPVGRRLRSNRSPRLRLRLSNLLWHSIPHPFYGPVPGTVGRLRACVHIEWLGSEFAIQGYEQRLKLTGFACSRVLYDGQAEHGGYA
jgi:hypothetical protein